MKKLSIILCLLCAGLKNYAQTNYVVIQDSRTVNNSPSDFTRRLALDFKESSVIGVPGVGMYSAVLTVAPWYDYTGGKNHQLSFNDGGVFYRMGNQSVPTWESWRRLLIEDDNGNVGIGTLDTKGYKLAVAGNMIAESVKVRLQGTWPDYVFSNSYINPSLQETEKHIKEKGYLPGIPSAEEIKANGIDLGEMNAKLLQKIEELTLHLIEMQKKVEMQDIKLVNQDLEIQTLKIKR